MAVRVIQARPIVGNTIAPPAQKLRVAAYARISTDDDSQETSLAGQMAYFENLIKGNDEWSYAGLYYDDGISGTSTKKRDGFNRMMADCEAGLIDKILAKSISRFSRNVVDCITALRRCRELGVEVFFEKENLSSMDPTADLLLTIMSSLSQQESASISANVAMGIRYRFQQGVQMINCSRFLGYKKNPVTKDLEIEPEGAQTVRLIFRWFLEGHSDIDIAMKLRKLKMLSGSGRTDWPVVTVTYMLQNERYAGDSLLQKTLVQNFLTHKSIKNKGQLPQYYVENSHPPIIPKEVFNLAQVIVHTSNLPVMGGRGVAPNLPVMGGRGPSSVAMDGGAVAATAAASTAGTAAAGRSAPKKYALSGKLVCGCCGQPYKRFANKRDGDTWKCKGKIKGECHGRVVKEKEVHLAVIRAFQRLPVEETNILKLQAQARLLLNDVAPRIAALLAGEDYAVDNAMLNSTAKQPFSVEHTGESRQDKAGGIGQYSAGEGNQCGAGDSLENVAAHAALLYVAAASLLDLIGSMKGRTIKVGDPKPETPCYTLEDFIARTRETPAKWKWRFDNEMVDRYIEKIVVGEGEMVVRFKGGVSFTSEKR